MAARMPYRGVAAGLIQDGAFRLPAKLETSSPSFAGQIRFGRLDRASSRIDRERAEAVLSAILPAHARKVIWADDLPRALGRVAGRNTVMPLYCLRSAGQGPWRIGGPRYREVRRIERVAALDAQLLRASRHVAASRVAPEDRLAYRTSLPKPVLVSDLARAVVDRGGIRLDSGAVFLAAELAASAVHALWFLDGCKVLAVPRPDVSLVGDELHALERPAVRWSRESLWFWHDIWIPAHLAERREQLGLSDVLGIRNVERRRAVIEVLGFERLTREVGSGVPASEDDYGRLWRLGPLLDDEEYVVVEVVNSTPESDGSFRRYFLRVPPVVKTPREAIAWTFEMGTREYLLAAES